MDKEKALDLLKLLSNLESVLDMNVFNKQVPDWLMSRLEDEVQYLYEYIKENKNGY